MHTHANTCAETSLHTAGGGHVGVHTGTPARFECDVVLSGTIERKAQVDPSLEVMTTRLVEGACRVLGGAGGGARPSNWPISVNTSPSPPAPINFHYKPQ